GFILYDKQGDPYRMIGAMTDITEKKRLERKLVQQQIKHHKLITEIAIESQEKEKNELGIELHDNINQILATVKMYLGMVKLKEENSDELVEKSFEHVTLAMDEIRKLSHSLVPPDLGDIGLKNALKELITEMNISKKIQINLSNEIDSDKPFDKKIELIIYRIVQEQMNNIFKYSGATKVLISLKKDDNTIFLSVSDNGIGFDTTRTRKGIGLKNIQSRVDFYTGNMKIISAPGQGCTLEINFPVNNKTEPA
ncbi:MAG: sensor histidine kinase, partial [Chitinophagaceae bacterium]